MKLKALAVFCLIASFGVFAAATDHVVEVDSGVDFQEVKRDLVSFAEYAAEKLKTE